MIAKTLSTKCPHCSAACGQVALGELLVGAIFDCGSFLPKLTARAPGEPEGEGDKLVQTRACKEIVRLQKLISLNVGCGNDPKQMEALASYIDESNIAPIVTPKGRQVYILRVKE